jgi:hypothetical protein
METLTFQQSKIHGTVLGKPVLCELRGAPSGLQLPAGHYLLLPAVKSAIYGQVMPIQPLGPGGATMHQGTVKSPSQFDVKPGAGFNYSPIAPTAMNYTPVEHKVAAPAIKFDSARQQAPSIVISEHAMAGGNCFVATAGFADLVDVVQRAGGITLVVR